MFREGLGAFFPQAWAQRREFLPAPDRAGDVVEAYSRMLEQSDPVLRQQAAFAWCLWESATPDWPPTAALSPRFRDPAYALGFARLVTHYVRHNAWLDDGVVMRDARRLSGIPGILINGRFDFQAPIGTAYELHALWPGSDLVIVDDAGHAANQPGITEQLVRATDRFAAEVPHDP